jgi:integral membrane protein
MAFTTATLLVVLVFVGVPLQLAAGQPVVVNDVGTVHGLLYLVYLAVAFDFCRRLRVPKWQMLLVLLAGTVPLCAFVAERKLTRRFADLGGAGASAPSAVVTRLEQRAARWRMRWLSPRAIVLHLELLVVAPGCLAAGWWQATRALAGNGLSWVYSIEWPAFAVVATVVWWHLVHEDLEAYRARRWRRGQVADAAVAEPASGGEVPAVRPPIQVTRLSTVLAGAVAVELLLGVMAIVSVPFDRPSGWLPHPGSVVYAVHGVVGLIVAAGSGALVVRVAGGGRIERATSWLGVVCVLIAGVGGLLTEPHSLVRFLGVALMAIGSLLALLCYLVPAVIGSRRRAQAAPVARAQRVMVGADGGPSGEAMRLLGPAPMGRPSKEPGEPASGA